LIDKNPDSVERRVDEALMELDLDERFIKIKVVNLDKNNMEMQQTISRMMDLNKLKDHYKNLHTPDSSSNKNAVSVNSDLPPEA
jgi:hypothetical protein